MNKENMIKWIEDLESGKFDQIKGAMCDNEDRYCCLGVASCITCPLSNRIDPYSLFDELETDGLPEATANWLEIRLEQGALASLNDIGLSFNEIAYFLRKDIESYPATRFLDKDNLEHIKLDMTENNDSLLKRLKREIANV